MTRHFLWDEHAELLTKPLATVLMDLRREDGDNDLLMDSVTLAELTEEADRMLAIDGVVAQYNQIERVAGQMEAVMRRAAGTVKPVAKQISDPFTQHGALQVVVLFELSDGQTISIYFHNPDTTPKKIAATDELVSWKWLLNKKDVTILVAPEQGKELNAREVARRVMKAAEKNSAAFVRNNAKRAERLQAIEAMKTEIVELETECKDLERQIEVARVRQDEPEPTGELPSADEPATVEISGTELGEFPETPEGLKALREAARQHLLDMRGEMIDCPAIGGQVEIRKRGIKETMAFSGNPKKLKLVPAIKSLIRSAVDAEWEGNAKPEKKPDVLGYYLIKSAAKIGDEAIKVDLLIEKDKKGNLYYDLLVDRAQTKAALDCSVAASASKHSPDNDSGDLDDFNLGDLPEGVKFDSAVSGVLVLNLFIEGEEPEVIDEQGDEDNPYWSALSVTDRAATLAAIGYQTKTGRPNAKAKAMALMNWGDLDDEVRAKLLEYPALNPDARPVDPEPEPPEPTDETDIDPDAIARVDAAYRFADASDEFKAWVAESVDRPDYSPFVTAREMDKRAKAHGATIEWGFFGGAALDAVYVEDDDEGDVALDASDHWKKQPRDKKSGRWVLRRMKRMKQAVEKAGESVANAARKAGDYVANVLKGAGKASGKAGHGAGDALEGGAKIDPGLAAINEIVGGAKTVSGAFDSAAMLDAVSRRYGDTVAAPMSEYIGKIRKDGEVVGRVDIDPVRGKPRRSGRGRIARTA